MVSSGFSVAFSVMLEAVTEIGPSVVSVVTAVGTTFADDEGVTVVAMGVALLPSTGRNPEVEVISVQI